MQALFQGAEKKALAGSFVYTSTSRGLVFNSWFIKSLLVVLTNAGASSMPVVTAMHSYRPGWAHFSPGAWGQSVGCGQMLL